MRTSSIEVGLSLLELLSFFRSLTAVLHCEGVPIVSKESIAGARRFAAGAGRGGSFDAR